MILHYNGWHFEFLPSEVTGWDGGEVRITKDGRPGQIQVMEGNVSFRVDIRPTPFAKSVATAFASFEELDDAHLPPDYPFWSPGSGAKEVKILFKLDSLSQAMEDASW